MWNCNIVRLALAALILIFTFSVTSRLLAVDIVVDQRSVQASDQNEGTKEKPLKTISAAAARVKAGDHVIIYGGEYRETVIIKASGTPDAPIVFEAAPGEMPVIKGSDVITGWTRQSPNLWKAKLPPIPARTGNNDEPAYWRTNDVRQVFLKDGQLLDAVSLRATHPDTVKEGNFFCDKANSEIYVWLKESEDPNRLTIEASVRGAWMWVTGDNVTVRNLSFRHSSTLAFAQWPAAVVKGNNVTLERCAFSWGDFVGVSIGGNQDRLIQCTIACNGCAGIGGSGENHVIEGCRVIYNNVDRYYFDWHAGGAKLIPSFSRGRIVHNEFAYNMGHALWLDGACNDNLLEANYCHDNEGAGIVVEISAGNRIFNNISVGNRNPLAADFLIPSSSSEDHKDGPFQTVRRGGESLGQAVYQAGDGRGIYISSSPQTKVYHNTCYLNEGEGICVEGPLRKETDADMSARDCEVFNNIIAYNKGAQLVLRRNGSDPNTRGNNSDYNLMVGRGAVLAEAGWGVIPAMKLADWQKSSGNDRHSVVSDPSFTMAAMGDFRILPISPASHVAPAVGNVAVDFYGAPRPNQNVTIGACEPAGARYPIPVNKRIDQER